MFLTRHGGQAQFSAQLAARLAETSSIRELQAHTRDHLGADLGAARLARRAAMSERNRARLFNAEVGMTVAKFVEKARLEAERRRLESA